MITYIRNNHVEIVQDLIQHVWLSLLPVLIGALLALPVGYLAVRKRWLYQPVVNAGAIIYSIPSLALFLILPPLLGVGYLSSLNVIVGLSLYTLALPVGFFAVRKRWLYQPVVNAGAIIYSIPSLALFLILPPLLGVGYLSSLNVIVGLSLYTLALLSRTVADALISVQGQATQAARALGYRPLRQLFGVELPMAMPVLFAGLRVATVANISLVSVGALVGSGGLGNLFTGGFQLGFVEAIIVGIVLSMLLAALCDVALVLLQRQLTPWTRTGART